MSIDAKDIPLTEPIFTFAGNDGSTIRIAVTRLRQWCLDNKPTVFLMPTEPLLAQKFVNNHKSVDLMRVLSMVKKDLEEPILYCRFDKVTRDVMLVDGRHRYTRAALFDQKPYIECWVLEVEQWKPFEIIGAPAITQDQLRATPVFKPHWNNKEEE